MLWFCSDQFCRFQDHFTSIGAILSPYQLHELLSTKMPPCVGVRIIKNIYLSAILIPEKMVFMMKWDLANMDRWIMIWTVSQLKQKKNDTRQIVCLFCGIHCVSLIELSRMRFSFYCLSFTVFKIFAHTWISVNDLFKNFLYIWCGS